MTGKAFSFGSPADVLPAFCVLICGAEAMLSADRSGQFPCSCASGPVAANFSLLTMGGQFCEHQFCSLLWYCRVVNISSLWESEERRGSKRRSSEKYRRKNATLQVTLVPENVVFILRLWEEWWLLALSKLFCRVICCAMTLVCCGGTTRIKFLLELLSSFPLKLARPQLPLTFRGAWLWASGFLTLHCCHQSLSSSWAAPPSPPGSRADQ